MIPFHDKQNPGWGGFQVCWPWPDLYVQRCMYTARALKSLKTSPLCDAYNAVVSETSGGNAIGSQPTSPEITPNSDLL